MSRPVWARGLKHHKLADMPQTAKVAPRVGAWIETSVACNNSAV